MLLQRSQLLNSSECDEVLCMGPAFATQNMPHCSVHSLHTSCTVPGLNGTSARSSFAWETAPKPAGNGELAHPDLSEIQDINVCVQEKKKKKKLK